MTRKMSEGTCDKCTRTFGYYLIHNGFNESCYAYCSICGMTAVIDTHYKDRTAEGFPRHRSITSDAEPFLASCPCGGSFKAGAAPRCPHCKEKLSAIAAASWIEASAAGSAQGWRWQRDWEGLYAIVIEGRLMSNPMRTQSTHS
jgi:hypothetical protein